MSEKTYGGKTIKEIRCLSLLPDQVTDTWTPEVVLALIEEIKRLEGNAAAVLKLMDREDRYDYDAILYGTIRKAIGAKSRP